MHQGITDGLSGCESKKLFSRYSILGLNKYVFLLFLGWLCIGAAQARQKPELSAPAAVERDNSAAQQIKRFVNPGSKPIQPPESRTVVSQAEIYNSPKRKEPAEKSGRRELRNPALKFAEVEIVVTGKFSMDYISSLPRAPGSELEVLDGGKRVRVQLASSQVKQLVKKGADTVVLRKFILVEGFKRGEAAIADDVIAAVSYCYGYNSSNVTIPDGSATWVNSPICISCAPSGATVTYIDVHYEIIHTCNSDLDVDLNDESLDCEYSLWQMSAPTTCPDNIFETETDITVCYGELVNQCWKLWAIDWWTYDSGHIDYWWIKVYYETCEPPANDDCVDAIAVAEDVPYFGSSDCATGSDISSCSFNDISDVWLSYTPTTTGTFTVDLCGSLFDTTLSVFNGCGGTELACNDDVAYPVNTTSRVTVDMNEGTTYLIRIAGYDGDAGDYTLVVTREFMVPSKPQNPGVPNDACEVSLDTVLSWNGGSSTKARGYSKGSTSEETPLPKVIYGSDDRLDEYEVNDADILAVGDSTAALVSVYDLFDNGDGTFSLPSATFAEVYLANNGWPLCSDEPFRDQPVSAYCSGFLVAPDLIATAGHCQYTCNPEDIAVVFGFVMLDANTAVITIDSSEVYYTSEVIRGVEDWMLIRLDREVTNHNPLAVRSTGKVADGEPLMVIGHPMGLPRKYAGGASVRENSESGYFQANLDTYTSNSGSAVFNANTLEVEGILVRGQVDFVPDGDCDRSNVCPDTGCPEWEDVTRTTEFTDLLSAYDVYLDVNNPPTELICGDVDVRTCAPSGGLMPCTTYYWQVVAKNSCGQTAGNVWSFMTGYGVWDFEPDCNVNNLDLRLFVGQWLHEKPSADLASDTGDGFVNFLDWAIFGHAWGSTLSSGNWDPNCDIAPEGGDGIIDGKDLAAFADQWLKIWFADIAPDGGDRIVNILDFAVLAENWLVGP